MNIARKFKRRILALVTVLFYTSSFIWGYIEWTCPVWGYMGFSYEPQSIFRFLGVIVTCLLPTVWIPLEHKRPTMVIYWMLYLMTYIPLIVGVGLAAHFNTSQVFWFSFSTVFAFYLNGIFYNFKKIQFNRAFVNEKSFWIFYTIITLIFIIFIFYVYRGTLSFVSPFSDNLYDKRAFGVNVGKGTAVGYPIMWCAGAFFPFLFAYGVYYKKNILVIISIIGNVYLFMTQADKAFLYSFVWLGIFFYLMKKTKYIGLGFTFLFSIIIFILSWINVNMNLVWQLAVFSTTSTIFVRLTGVSAFTATIYYNFFDETHPYTYFSHVNLFNKFITYPYDDMIGKVVASTVSDNPDFNANATFYITDGLCSLGLWGIPVAGFLCGLTFHVIDSVANRHDLKFATLAIVYSGVNIMNASIFTSVFSGGLIWLFIFFYIMKPKDPSIA